MFVYTLVCTIEDKGKVATIRSVKELLEDCWARVAISQVSYSSGPVTVAAYRRQPAARAYSSLCSVRESELRSYRLCLPHPLMVATNDYLPAFVSFSRRAKHLSRSGALVLLHPTHSFFFLLMTIQRFFSFIFFFILLSMLFSVLRTRLLG